MTPIACLSVVTDGSIQARAVMMEIDSTVTAVMRHVGLSVVATRSSNGAKGVMTETMSAVMGAINAVRLSPVVTASYNLSLGRHAMTRT